MSCQALYFRWVRLLQHTNSTKAVVRKTGVPHGKHTNERHQRNLTFRQDKAWGQFISRVKTLISTLRFVSQPNKTNCKLLLFQPQGWIFTIWPKWGFEIWTRRRVRVEHCLTEYDTFLLHVVPGCKFPSHTRRIRKVYRIVFLIPNYASYAAILHFKSFPPQLTIYFAAFNSLKTLTYQTEPQERWEESEIQPCWRPWQRRWNWLDINVRPWYAKADAPAVSVIDIQRG